jgi:hypothetical protein
MKKLLNKLLYINMGRKRNMNKTILAIGIIALFIGVSIIPSTNGITIPIQRNKVSDVDWSDFSIATVVVLLKDVTKQWNESLEVYEYTGTIVGGFGIIWEVFRFPPFFIPANRGATVTISKKFLYHENFITRVAIIELPVNRLFFRILAVGFVGDSLMHLL